MNNSKTWLTCIQFLVHRTQNVCYGSQKDFQPSSDEKELPEAIHSSLEIILHVLDSAPSFMEETQLKQKESNIYLPDVITSTMMLLNRTSKDATDSLDKFISMNARVALQKQLIHLATKLLSTTNSRVLYSEYFLEPGGFYQHALWAMLLTAASANLELLNIGEAFMHEMLQNNELTDVIDLIFEDFLSTFLIYYLNCVEDVEIERLSDILKLTIQKANDSEQLDKVLKTIPQETCEVLLREDALEIHEFMRETGHAETLAEFFERVQTHTYDHCMDFKLYHFERELVVDDPSSRRESTRSTVSSIAGYRFEETGIPDFTVRS